MALAEIHAELNALKKMSLSECFRRFLMPTWPSWGETLVGRRQQLRCYYATKANSTARFEKQCGLDRINKGCKGANPFGFDEVLAEPITRFSDGSADISFLNATYSVSRPYPTDRRFHEFPCDKRPFLAFLTVF